MKRVIRASVEKKYNPRKHEYDEYLENHINNVQRSWYEILKPVIEDNYDADINQIDQIIDSHDRSKYSDAEYDAYLNWFYPSDGFAKDEAAYDRAWLHHQHMNPHHPQHWILVRDEGEIQPLDMPFEQICAMLCDWHSFSVNPDGSTAYEWYQENKKNMTLSDNTRAIVEELIEYLRDKLEE